MIGRSSRLLGILLLQLVLGLALIGWVSLAPVEAQEETKGRPTSLTIEPLSPLPVGERPTVKVTLVNEAGRRLTNKPLRVYLDGEQVRQARTDDTGVASIRIPRDLPVGKYSLRVLFIGTEDYRRSLDQTTLTVRPVQLEIETVPPLEGIEFKFDNRTHVSGEDGFVRIELDELGTYPLEVNVPEEDYAPGTHLEFERWRRAYFEPDREAIVNGDTKLQIGFGLYHPISFTFSDLLGRPVDESRITSITLKSSTGELLTLESSGPHWLQANRIARRVTGLDVTPIQYGVESVIIDGASVVNQYQQRFFVEPNDIWSVELLLYSARFQSADALFGFSVGDGVDLRYPDGRVESLKFDADNTVFIDSLARGDYTVQVTGVGGMAPETPVALSKDQDVTLKVLTNLDMGLAITVGTVAALGLLLYGRPSLLYVPKNAVVYLYRLPRRFKSRKDEPVSI